MLLLEQQPLSKATVGPVSNSVLLEVPKDGSIPLQQSRNEQRTVVNKDAISKKTEVPQDAVFIAVAL